MDHKTRQIMSRSAVMLIILFALCLLGFGSNYAANLLQKKQHIEDVRYFAPDNITLQLLAMADEMSSSENFSPENTEDIINIQKLDEDGKTLEGIGLENSKYIISTDHLTTIYQNKQNQMCGKVVIAEDLKTADVFLYGLEGKPIERHFLEFNESRVTAYNMRGTELYQYILQTE